MPRRLLIVDPTATNRIGLKALLTNARYDPAACASGAEGLTALEKTRPDAIVLDQLLPDMSAATFCRRARAALGDATPPILVLLEDNDPATRLDTLQAGADSLIERPVERAWLLTHLRALLRAWETRAELQRRSLTAARIGFADSRADFAGPARIAMVGTDTGAARLLARKLRPLISHTVDVLSSEEALGLAEPATPTAEVFLICRGPAPEDDLALLSELRARTDSKRAAILVQYVEDNGSFGARALDQGASDLFRMDARIDEIALRAERQLKIKRQSDALRASVEAGLALAAHDPLTGLFNRRYAMPYLDDLAHRCRDGGASYGLLLLDIDHFKSINDAHGHAAGDAVLAQVARRLSDTLREGDLLARIGGEEFLVVLPSVTREEAWVTAERLRRAVADKIFACPSGTTLRVSLSAGVVCGRDTPACMLDRADAAMYRAKDEGRNRVAMAQDAPLHRTDPIRATAPPANAAQYR